MGYTHYWSGPRNITPEAVEDIQKIIASSRVSIHNGMGEGEPEVSTEFIRINGNAENGEDYETFYVGQPSAWDFCKTARKPYDKVVGAILLRIREDSPQFDISSDGTWTEWRAARRLFERVMGHEPIKVL